MGLFGMTEVMPCYKVQTGEKGNRLDRGHG